MQNNFFVFFFPSLLIFGTLILGYRELHSYFHMKASGSLPRWAITRLVRRSIGLVIMMSIGIMIIVGVTRDPAMTPSIGFMKFWLTCFFLVVCVLVLAIWDAICELRKIKEYVEEFRQTEIKNVSKKFKIYTN